MYDTSNQSSLLLIFLYKDYQRNFVRFVIELSLRARATCAVRLRHTVILYVCIIHIFIAEYVCMCIYVCMYYTYIYSSGVHRNFVGGGFNKFS